MLTLAIETSTATFAVAAGGAVRTLAGVAPADRDLPALVAALLAGTGHGFADVDRIAVDIGPGNLTAVRTGVAYANGLAFALGARVATADSLELLAAQVDGPALCLRNAGGGRVYAYLDGTYRHGPLRDVVTDLVRDEVTVAGDFRAEAAALLPDVLVKDSGLAGPDVRTLLRLTEGRPTLDPTVERAAAPLTENSAVFGGDE